MGSQPAGPAGFEACPPGHLNSSTFRGLKMSMPTADEAAQKWAKNLGASTTSITNGVNRVDRSPMEKAAAKVNEYVAGVQEAAASGKWARGLRRTTLESWKEAMLKKGLNRIASGANAAIPKYQSFASQFFPYLSTGMAQVASMPDSTFEDRVARSVAMQTYNHNFRRSS